jgi:hypothetical protein
LGTCTLTSTDPCHYLTFGQIASAHHRPPASIIFTLLIGRQERLEFGLNRLS